MQPAKVNYKIYQGSTFQQTYRWESQTKVYVPIQSIAKSAPCVITTSQLHQMPTNWRFKVVGAGGMKEINTSGDNYYIATETSGNSITINQVNSLLYTAYTGGGVIEYNQPVPLNNLSARMQLRESVDSNTILYEATSTGGQILVDNTNKTIIITILGDVTSTFDFVTAVYSLELYNGNNVIPFLVGNITLVPEVTR
jgi:hypothetical protein